MFSTRPKLKAKKQWVCVEDGRIFDRRFKLETHRRDKGYSRKIAKEDAMRFATLEWSETAAARLAAELAEAEGSGTERDQQKQGRSGGGRNDAPFDAGSAAQKAAHERETRQRELLKKKLAWQCSLCGQAGNPPKCEKCKTCGRPRGYEPALCARDGGGHAAPHGIAHSKIEHERTVFDRAFLGALASMDSTYWLEHTSARDIVTAGDRETDMSQVMTDPVQPVHPYIGDPAHRAGRS